ncbi:hypothetical protein EJD97_012096, partial [Solanum chilense]
MNTRRKVGGKIGGAAAGVNHVPPQAPAAEIEMFFNPSGLTNREVRTALVHITQVITLQAQDMKAQAEQQGVIRENPPSSTMANRLRDFTRMNPPVYTGSKIV